MEQLLSLKGWRWCLRITFKNIESSRYVGPIKVGRGLALARGPSVLDLTSSSIDILFYLLCHIARQLSVYLSWTPSNSTELKVKNQ